MLIDWFTVGAQAINFLLLVWLLKRFLYKPILSLIDAREKRIATELEGATAKKAEAQKERNDFEKKNQDFDAQRATLLGQATNEAKTERERLLDAARKEAEGLRAKQESALQNDLIRLGSEVARLAKEEVFGITRKALADLATASLEERLGEVFTRRLREMDGPAKEAWAKALKSSSEPVLVRSAFDLPKAPREAIQNALNEGFSASIPLRFETSPEAICGIEMTAGGQKIAWSIADYLVALEKQVAVLLDAPAASKAQAVPITKPENIPTLKWVEHAEIP